MAEDKTSKRLRIAGIRPTKIRIALAELLLNGEDRHVTVEEVIAEAREANIRTSVASVYNTLNQFSESGLVNKIIVDSGPVFFDTNTDNHYHLYNEATCKLQDIPAETLEIKGLPELASGQTISSIDVTIRIK